MGASVPSKSNATSVRSCAKAARIGRYFAARIGFMLPPGGSGQFPVYPERCCYHGTVRLEDLGLIGNCQCAALVDRGGAIQWCCLPRFDSEPVFGGLLDPDGGRFLVGPADGRVGTQRY